MSSPENSPSIQSQHQAGKMKLELAWDVLKELGTSEWHFNNLEAEYRKKARFDLVVGRLRRNGFHLKRAHSWQCHAKLRWSRSVWRLRSGSFYFGLSIFWSITSRWMRASPKRRRSRKRIRICCKCAPVWSTRKAVENWSPLRWFYILLASAPIVFSTPLFVLWCQKQYEASAALIAGVISLIYILGTSGIIWTNPRS
jgi:hypothetical protein